MIKAVCFDLDGVYFLNGKSNFIKSLVELSVSEDEAKRVFLKSGQMNLQYKAGNMTDNDFWTWALIEMNLNLSVSDVVDLLIKGYEVNTPAADYVKKLRKAGYKTVICSNNFPARINGLQKRFKFLDDFDTAVFSYEVGSCKPDKPIFEELIKQAGVAPDEIFYSDDDETKMEGAKELGITTYLYTNFDEFVKKLEELGISI